MNKKYEYNGKIYCDDDLSEEIENYGGCLWDLYFELKKEDRATEEIIYFDSCHPEVYYETVEELIEGEFSDLEVNEDVE